MRGMKRRTWVGSTEQKTATNLARAAIAECRKAKDTYMVGGSARASLLRIRGLLSTIVGYAAGFDIDQNDIRTIRQAADQVAYIHREIQAAGGQDVSPWAARQLDEVAAKIRSTLR